MEAEKASGRMLILYAGAHGPSNALHEVLEALAILRESDAQTYERMAIVFIGDGPTKGDLRDQCAVSRLEHVFFFDPVPKLVAFAAMRRSDFVLIHFAKADFKRYGMSANKLFDAMMLGRPVLVSTPLNDTPVDSVKCGIRYEPGSTASLASALAAAVYLPDEDQAEMGDRGQREGRRRYSIQVTSRVVEDVLADVIQRDRQQPAG
jgi:glycosyltransferase involved in cell wall biosynthesis